MLQYIDHSVTDDEDDEKKFTKKQDAIIRRMKSEKKTHSWQGIADAVGGKSKEQCKARWKEMNAGGEVKPVEAVKGQDASKKQDDAKKGDKDKESKKREGEDKKDEEKADDVNKDKGKKEKARLEIKVPNSDKYLTRSELEVVTDLYRNEMSLVWHRVASQYFDMTGQRLHPEDVEDMFARTR